MDKSTYLIEEHMHSAVFQYMDVMKIIMVKGFGYIVVSKSTTLTPDLLLDIAEYMESQGINKL